MQLTVTRRSGGFLIAVLMIHLLTPGGVGAQPSGLDFVHHPEDTGLGSNSVNDLAKDQTGYLWLATSRGLHRFDGYRFKAYLHDPKNPTSLPDNHASIVYSDSRDRIWVGTQEGGVALLDRGTEQFTSYFNDTRDWGRISHNQVTGIEELEDGTIIVATASGYNLFDEATRAFSIVKGDGGVGVGKQERDSLIHKLRSVLIESGSSLLPSTALPPNYGPAAAPIPDSTELDRLLSWSQYLYYDTRQAYSALADLFPRQQTDEIWSLLQPLLEMEEPEGSGRNAYSNISSLYVDSLDNIFLGYKFGGIGVVRPGASVPEILRYNNNHRSVLNYSEVNDMTRVGDTLYIGVSHAGLMAIDLQTGRRIGHPVNTEAESVYSISRRGPTMYFATTSGMHVYDRRTGRTITYDNHQNMEWSMIASECSVILPDEDGVVWAGHFFHGLSKGSAALPFHSDPDPAGDPLPYYMRSVSAIEEDSRGRLWLGYFEGGIRRAGPGTMADEKYYVYANKNGIRRSSIFTIFESSTGGLYGGGYGSGLLRYDEQLDDWYAYPKSAEMLGGNDVRSIVEDARGRLYIAVHSVGITEFDPRTGAYRSIESENGKVFSPYVFDLEVDAEDRLWIATVGGVYRLDADRKVVTPILVPGLGHPDGFRHRANVIEIGPGGTVWVGTQEGLLALDQRGKPRADLTIPEELQGSAIRSMILEAGPSGKLWMSVQGQLFSLDPTTGLHAAYDPPSRFKAGQFRRGGAFRTENGELMFGYNNGVIRFDPADLPPPPRAASPFITNVAVFEGGGGQKSVALQVGDELNLPHNNMGVSIDISTLYFAKPEAVKYQARLLPSPGDWQDIEGDQPRYVLYNLPPGDHTVEFRAEFESGPGYSRVSAIRISVSPPWYASGLAYVFYAVLITMGLYGYRMFIKRRAELTQSVAIAQIKTDNTREMAESKARFFVNVSHELRTPLTLINGPLTELMKEPEPDGPARARLYELMDRNTTRLRRLVDRLLDVQKVESEAPDLRFEEGDIVSYLRMTVQSFHPKAQTAGIELVDILPDLIRRVNYSPEVIDRICTNLLSNALKFTPEGGRVTFRAIIFDREAEQRLLLEVEDDGPGIPKDEQLYLFERFYRGQNGQHVEGSGVGLSIVKQYAELIGGEVSCISDVGQGSIFRCSLPLHPAVVGLDAEVQADADGRAGRPSGDKRPHVLVADDDSDIRSLIRFGCDEHFYITEAADGDEALRLAENLQPDLVLTDLMMPGLDGIELCRSLKADPRTSHLPVLLLTARHSESARAAALEAGANDFITKPFELDNVIAKIDNTLRTIQAARHRWIAEPSELSAERLTSVDTDKEFLKALRAYVEENMDVSDLSTDDLLRHLTVSRSVCYAKVKALTGLPLKAFIKQLRIGRARQLLSQTDLTVGEVAYQTGFKTTQHFSRSFRQIVGSSPTQFRAKEVE